MQPDSVRSDASRKDLLSIAVSLPLSHGSMVHKEQWDCPPVGDQTIFWRWDLGKGKESPALAPWKSAADLSVFWTEAAKSWILQSGLATGKTGFKIVSSSSSSGKNRINLIRPKPALFHQSLAVYGLRYDLIFSEPSTGPDARNSQIPSLPCNTEFLYVSWQKA